MSGGEDEAAEKSHEPSQKKLDDARAKGDIPRSADLNTAAAYAGLVLGGVLFGGVALRNLGEVLSGLMEGAPALAEVVDRGGSAAALGGAMGDVTLALMPFLIPPVVLVLASVWGQRSMVFTGSKLQPKMSRISILSNAKQKFGRNGLFEFAKSATKLTIYSVALFLFLASSLPEIFGLVAVDPALGSAMAMTLSLRFLVIVLIVALAIGVVDVAWQRAEHTRRNMMSRKEMTDEHKESEGDPHMKHKRRQKGIDIASNRMLADVPDAAVVVVNPTHYAVALKWSRSAQGAPVCVAKGVDLVAARIREAAAEAGVPIHSDPPTARALHAVVEIGEEIRPEHYAAVAVAIRFAEDMRRKARSR